MDSPSARGLRTDAVMAGSVLMLGLFLFVAGMGLTERWQQSAARRQGPGVDDLLGAIAVSAGLAIVAWWILSVLLAVAAAVLEKGGKKRAAASAGKCCPAFMRRLAVAAFSVQLLAAPLAQAAVPPEGPAWVPTQEVALQAHWAPAAVARQIPLPEKTGTPAPATPSPRPQAPAAPPSAGTQDRGTPAQTMQGQDTHMQDTEGDERPDLLDTSAAKGQEAQDLQDALVPATQVPEPRAMEPQPTERLTPAVQPEWRPSAPLTDPGLLAAQPVRAVQGAQGPARDITVLAGDTLWDIASRELGPTATDVDVALRWPRWYEANRAEIGTSPHVLLPGQILKSPSTA
ncbi:LysM peptidoglycan-binding domain-containing protein [Arthrobacter sp. HMWF013]|uniref:LysM peptidoglycan-binding domain-containing protein n=1 Tax=Arthrobacter sp. HMWF013 TaxID=2056849 RepID=UPI000D331ABB|nr:LysM domain-containing protein [Arthrobacter sp. HMWF013]PTT69708.1 hypothetical protein DBR22_03090 [Arthrobacter sp. HMWF013]